MLGFPILAAVHFMQPIGPMSFDSPYQVPGVLGYGAAVLVLNEINPHLQSWKTIRQK